MCYHYSFPSTRNIITLRGMNWMTTREKIAQRNKSRLYHDGCGELIREPRLFRGYKFSFFFFFKKNLKGIFVTLTFTSSGAGYHVGLSLTGTVVQCSSCCASCWPEVWPEQPDLMQAPVVWCLPGPTGAPWQCNKTIHPLPSLFLNLFCLFWK